MALRQAWFRDAAATLHHLALSPEFADDGERAAYQLFEGFAARLLEVCGGVVHALSYQQARNFQLPVGSVYVAEPGYVLGLAGVAKHAIITVSFFLFSYRQLE